MKKETQRTNNPYKFSDSNKRYQTFDYYLRALFGEKCAKIPLDAGFSCPNIDGCAGHGGCIYCSGGSSAAIGETLREQYERGVEIMTRKWDCKKFIPYLQAHTNTYAPVELLEKVYRDASSFPGAVMLAVATRADCLPKDILSLLARTSERIPLMIELGLQSTNDKTAEIINRGHTFEDFCKGYFALRESIPTAKIAVHLIDGLPGEDRADMIKSAVDVAALRPDVVKLHVLHVIKGTRLAEMWEAGGYTPLEQAEYVSTVCDQIERLPAECALGRITGDAKEDELLSPIWCRRKTAVANDIDKELYRRQTYQGIFYCN